MRFLLSILLIAGAARANTCTLVAATYPTWAATTGHWTGTGCTDVSYLPSAPDIVIVPSTSNPVLHIATGETVLLGSVLSGIGDALTVQGSSASVFGSVIVDLGGSLTLRGFDATTHRIGNIQRYAQFTNSGTVVGSSPSGVNGVLACDGICAGSGTLANPAIFTNETFSWGSAGTTTITNLANGAGTAPSTYFDGSHVYVSYLAHTWIGNAAGTALATSTDSSLVFSGQSCSPTCTDTFLTTAVSGLDLVTSTGKYYCEYRSGLCWWWMDSGVGKTVSFTGTYKRLTYDPWRIAMISSLDHNQGTFNYTNFSYMGRNDGSLGGVLLWKFKNMAGSVQGASVTNSRFDYCTRPIAISDSNGAAGNPILIDGNYMDCGPNNNSGYDSCVLLNIGTQSYITVTHNRAIGGNNKVPLVYATTTGTYSHIDVEYNTFLGTFFALGQVDSQDVWPNSTFSHNAIFSPGSSSDARQLAGLGGSAGNPSTIANNLSIHAMRALNLSPNETIRDNTFLFANHHGFSAPFNGNTNNTVYANGSISGTIVIGSNTGIGSNMDLGYNKPVWADQWNIQHNTLDGPGVNWAWTDSFDNIGPNLVTGLTYSNNLMTNGTVGVLRGADTSAWKSRFQITAADWNVVSGNSANYNGWNRFATFSGISNVAGVTLHNPSYSSPFSGKALTYTYTSATNITLTWDGGTPVQLVAESGTATAAANTNTGALSNGTLTDTAKTWTTAQNVTTTPAGKWLKVTGGTGVGQVRRVLSNTATVLTTVPEWTIVPDVTSTYSLVTSEVTLTAGDASTVQAGIDYRSALTSTQTDSGVGMTLNSSSAVVSYAYASGSLALWDAALGGSGTEWSGWQRLVANPSLIDQATAFIRRGFTPSNVATWCAGSDGETIGAIQFCAAGKAMIGAIQ